MSSSSKRIRIILFPVLWLIIYIVTSYKALIFAGDSLSYLNIANSIYNFNIPEIKVFMPIYPAFIAIFSKILHVDLISGARFVNGAMLFTAFSLMNYILVVKAKTNFLNQIIINAPFVSNVFFIEHSLKIMPEMLFLFSTFLVIYLQYLFINDENKRNDSRLTIFLSCAVTFSLFVKFNGIVHLVTTVLIFLIFLKKNWTLLIRKISIVSAFVLIPYFIYIFVGAGSEFLVSGANPVKTYKVADLMLFWSQWNNDFMGSFIHFFGTETSRIWLKTHSLHIGLVVIFNFLFISWVFFSIWVSFRKSDNLRFVLHLFIFTYLLMIFLRSVPVLKSEVNTRTIFYVLMLVETDLFVLFGRHLKNLIIKNYSVFSILMVSVVCSLIVVQTTRFARKCFEYKNNMQNISDLADPRFDFDKSEILKRTRFLMRKKNFSFNEVLTNQQKILGIYLQEYRELPKIPSSSVFNGNRNTVSIDQFVKMKNETDKKFLNGDAIMVVFHGRSVKSNPTENEYLKSIKGDLVTIENYREGYIAYIQSNKNNKLNNAKRLAL